MKLSRPVRFATVWLLGLGVVIAGAAVYGFATSRWACDEGSGSSFACDISNIAVAIGVIIAALHLAAGAGLWRGRVWAAALGAGISFLGSVAYVSTALDDGAWLVNPVAAGYLCTSLVLVYSIADRWARGRTRAASR